MLEWLMANPAIGSAMIAVSMLAQSVVIRWCWQQRGESAAALWQMIAMLGGLWWQAGNLIRLLIAPAPDAMLGLYAMGMAVLAGGYLLGVRSLIDIRYRAGPASIAGLAVVPAILLVLFVNPATRGMTTGTLATDAAGQVWWTPPLTFWLVVTYSVLVSGAAAVIESHAMRDATAEHAAQLRAHLIGFHCSAAGAAISLLVMYSNGWRWPEGMPEWMSVTLLITAIVDGRSIKRNQFLSATPITRGQMLAELDEGVLVFDGRRRLADLNPAARRLLGQDLQMGQPIDEVFNLLRPSGGADAAHSDYTTRAGREVSVRRKTVEAGPNMPSNDLVVIADLTDANRSKREVLQANEQLHSQLATIQRLQEELADQARRDSLTGLHNRRHLEEVFDRLGSLPSTGFGLIVVDLDHFKAVNDAHGHLIGDEVLVDVAEKLRAISHPGETLIRYGGEEFVMVWQGASLTQALAHADAICEWFASKDVKTSAGPLRLTTSIGVAARPDQGIAPRAVFRAADEALYRAKREGRNRVVAGRASTDL